MLNTESGGPEEPFDLRAATDVFQLLAQSGSLAILSALTRRPMFHNELMRATSLGHSSLKRALTRLRRKAVVARQPNGAARKAQGAHVPYCLTPRGQRLIGQIDQLCVLFEDANRA